MSIAEKLEIIAGNQQKVYEKGGLAVSPQETVSGETISISDVLPIEHDMSVTIRGKNLIPFPTQNTQWTINYYEGYSTKKNGITFTINADGSITTKGTATETVYFNIGKIALDTGDIVALVGGSSGNTYASCNLSISKYLRWDKNNGIVYYSISKNTTLDEVLYPQLELGTTLTPFTPYIENKSTVKLYVCGEDDEAITYDVLPDGTVEGVKSIYPNIRLYTDTYGAVVDCTYYQDGKKVKENLTKGN